MTFIPLSPSVDARCLIDRVASRRESERDARRAGSARGIANIVKSRVHLEDADDRDDGLVAALAPGPPPFVSFRCRFVALSGAFAEAPESPAHRGTPRAVA
jgi:hypothetical protein